MSVRKTCINFNLDSLRNVAGDEGRILQLPHTVMPQALNLQHTMPEAIVNSASLVRVCDRKCFLKYTSISYRQLGGLNGRVRQSATCLLQ